MKTYFFSKETVQNASFSSSIRAINKTLKAKLHTSEFLMFTDAISTFSGPVYKQYKSHLVI